MLRTSHHREERRHPVVVRSLMLLLLTIPASAQVILGAPASSAAAKESAPPVPGGTVTGRVVFADTDGPARFAKVLLKSVTPTDAGENPFTALMPAAGADDKTKKPKLSAADQAEQKQALAASAKVMGSLSDLLVSTTIGADGVYTFTNVPAGTYYVHAMAPGYIDPFSQFSADDLASTDPAVRARIAAVVPTVHVSGTDQARADLRLARGAGISGRVIYDDGTPAVGWTVRVVHDPAPGAAPAAFSAMGLDMSDMDLSHITEMAQTDDTGHFRIAGLPSGDFVLQARFTAPVLGHSSFNPVAGNALAAMQGLKLTVYSGNVLRRADATPISVRAGDERNGVDITMPLHSTHTLGGIVRAQSDGHAVNAGTVELTLQDANGNPDPSVHLAAEIQSDGAFHFDYVPSGTYQLKTSHAADATTNSVKKMFGSMIADQKITHSYGPATLTTIVGDTDVTDLKLDAPELPSEK
jgi:hypothetical protein